MTTNVPGSVRPTAAFCCRALNRFKGGGYNRHTDSRTDGQTDRRTDGQTVYVCIFLSGKGQLQLHEKHIYFIS